MYCPHCGNEHPDNSAFCPHCGKGLTVASESVTIQAPNGDTATTTETVVEDTASKSTSESVAVAQTETISQTTEPTQPAASVSATPTTNDPVNGVVSDAGQSTQNATAEQPAASATANPSATASTAAPAAEPASTAQTAAAAPVATAAPTKVYHKGCVSAAWSDIQSSEGWVGKTALLGLLQIVPILSWIVPGYSMRWARQLPLGQIESMPKEIFAPRTFVNGVFWFVIMLVFSLVSGVVGGILGVAPFLGWIGALAVGVFVSMYANVATIRAAEADYLTAGFQISAMWPAFKKNPGSLLCITLVPSLIAGLIIMVIGGIIFFIAMALSGSEIYNLVSYAEMASSASYFDYAPYGYYYGYDPTMSMFSILGAFVPAFFVVYVIWSFVLAFVTLLTYRAMGHWAARYATEWMDDPYFANQARIIKY